MSYSVDRIYSIARVFGVYKEWPSCIKIIEIYPDNPLHSINSAIDLGIDSLTLVLDKIDDKTNDLIALARLIGKVHIISIDDIPKDADYDLAILNDYDLLMARYSEQHISIMNSQDYFDAVSNNGLRKFSMIIESVKHDGLIVLKHQVARPDTHAPHIIDMLRYYVKDIAGLEEKVLAARYFLSILCDQDHENSSDFRQAKIINDMIQHLSSHNVFWKFLADSHERLPFFKFTSMAKSLGLKYISDYNLKSMLVGDIPIKIREVLNGLDDVIKNEQYLDYLRRRCVRSSIFIKTSNLTPINYEVSCDVISDFNIRFDVNAAKSLADYTSDDDDSFSFGIEQKLNTSQLLHKIVLKLLSEAYPKYLNIEVLIKSCSEYMALSSFEIPDRQDILNFILCLFFDASPDTIEFCGNSSSKLVATCLSASYSLSSINLELLITESEVIDSKGNYIVVDDFEREILNKLNSSMKVIEIISGQEKDEKNKIIRFIMKMLKAGIFLKV